MIVIYKHTNKINNKVYIGQTNNYKKRWSPCNYVGSTCFYSAIQKYGWENFSHEILATVLSQKEADDLEIYYISFYDSTNHQKGYNLAEGGNHKVILKGENNGFYGKKHTEEAIKIMKEKKKGGNNPKAKRVECVNTGVIFPSCREASEWCGVARQNIARAARISTRTAGKHPDTKERLKWRYIANEN